MLLCPLLTIPPIPFQNRKGEKNGFYVEFCTESRHKTPRAHSVLRTGHATRNDFFLAAQLKHDMGVIEIPAIRHNLKRGNDHEIL